MQIFFFFKRETVSHLQVGWNFRMVLRGAKEAEGETALLEVMGWVVSQPFEKGTYQSMWKLRIWISLVNLHKIWKLSHWERKNQDTMCVCVFHRIVMAEWYVYACSHGHTHVCAGIHVWAHAWRCLKWRAPCFLKHCFLLTWGSQRRLDCPESELQRSVSWLHPQRWIKRADFPVDSGHQTRVLVLEPQAFCWLSYLSNPP